MSSKKIIIPAFLFLVACTAVGCVFPDQKNEPSTESAVPAGLNDSVAGKTEETKAIDALQQGDSAAVKK